MLETASTHAPVMPSEDELASRHQTLQRLLQAKGELTRPQSDYAVLLSDKLIHNAHSGNVSSKSGYYNSANNPFDQFRQNVPVVIRAGDIYNTDLSRRAMINHMREQRGDEFKAAQALAPVLQQANEPVVRSALQLVTGLAFVLAREEHIFMATVQDVTGMPLSVARHVYEAARRDNIDFQLSPPSLTASPSLHGLHHLAS